MERTLSFFCSWLMALAHRWSKCITLEGNYVEKEEADLNRNKLDWSLVRNRSFDKVILKNMRKSRMFKLGKKYWNNLCETSEFHITILIGYCASLNISSNVLSL